MRLTTLFILLLPLFAGASNHTDSPLALMTDSQAMPDDFKNYFYHSEIPVLVYLNDKLLFEGDITMTEQGQVTLMRVTNFDTTHYQKEEIRRWEKQLTQGIVLGKKQNNHPLGLMAAEYSLDTSALKLYSNNYDKEKIKSRYFDVPTDTAAGLIINNDINYSGGQNSSHSSRFNSSWTSSLMGWSQKLSFQSVAYEANRADKNNFNLYEFYTQKEWQGHFLRLGYFSPGSDTGNVQTSGFGSDNAIGGMWGSSDTLLAEYDSVSLYPIYVTGQNESIAEIYRNGRLIYSQPLKAGIQPLDTQRLPSGIYDVTINIMENGKKIGEQSAQVYKPSRWGDSSKRWRYNLWSGQLNSVSSSADKHRPLALGGAADYLLHPRVIVGMAAAHKGRRQNISARSEITLGERDTLFGQLSTGNGQTASSDLRYQRNYHRGSIGLNWRHMNYVLDNKERKDKQKSSDSWGMTLSQTLPYRSSMTLRGEYTTAGARRGASADIGLNTTATLAGRDVSVRLIGYDRPSYRTEQQRDRGAEIGLSFSLERKRKTHSVSAQFGLQDRKPYTNLNYNWRPEERGTIEYAGATVTANPDGLAFSGNAGLDNRWLNGDVYLQRGSKSENFYGGANLRNSLVLGGGSIATGQQLRSSQAAVIIDVESDQPDIKLEVSGGEGRTPRLQPGKNIVGVSTWQQQRLQFHGQGEDGVRIYPEDYSLRMNRGSVNYLKLRAVKTQTVVGMLKDEQGNLLHNQEVASDVGKARINSEGVFTLEVSAAKPQITVTGDDGKPRLVYSLPPSPEGERDEVRFVDVLTPSASPLS